jgi:hypothetical protein
VSEDRLAALEDRVTRLERCTYPQPAPEFTIMGKRVSEITLDDAQKMREMLEDSPRHLSVGGVATVGHVIDILDGIINRNERKSA